MIGNRLAVDFANTIAPVSSRGSLQSWGDLVDFLAAAGVVSQTQRDVLKGLATTAPQDTRTALQAALELRESLQTALAAMAAGRPAPPECVHPVNTLLRWTEGYDQLAPSASGWRLDYVVREQRLEWLLAAIARSAAELIAEGPAAPIACSISTTRPAPDGAAGAPWPSAAIAARPRRTPGGIAPPGKRGV